MARQFQSAADRHNKRPLFTYVPIRVLSRKFAAGFLIRYICANTSAQNRGDYLLRLSTGDTGFIRGALRRSSRTCIGCAPVPTTCSRIKFVDPLLLCVPATTAIMSPGCTACCCRRYVSALCTMSSALGVISHDSGDTPHIRLSRAQTVVFAANAKIGAVGRYLEISRAVVPVSV